MGPLAVALAADLIRAIEHAEDSRLVQFIHSMTLKRRAFADAVVPRMSKGNERRWTSFDARLVNHLATKP